MGILKNKINEDIKGKNPESLRKSRQIRRKFVEQFGYVPESILSYDPSDKAIDMLVESEGRDYKKTHYDVRHKDVKHKEKRLFKDFHLSGCGCRGKSGALSRFPQNVGKILVSLYCPENGTVYDPFAGHNSRMQLVYESNRNYIGVDISHQFMEANREIKRFLMKKNKNSLLGNKCSIRLIEGSSANTPLDSECADFTITSPPYWDLEDRKSTRLNSSHIPLSRMPSSA